MWNVCILLFCKVDADDFVHAGTTDWTDRILVIMWWLNNISHTKSINRSDCKAFVPIEMIDCNVWGVGSSNLVLFFRLWNCTQLLCFESLPSESVKFLRSNSYLSQLFEFHVRNVKCWALSIIEFMWSEHSELAIRKYHEITLNCHFKRCPMTIVKEKWLLLFLLGPRSDRLRNRKYELAFCFGYISVVHFIVVLLYHSFHERYRINFKLILMCTFSVNIFSIRTHLFTNMQNEKSIKYIYHFLFFREFFLFFLHFANENRQPNRDRQQENNKLWARKHLKIDTKVHTWNWRPLIACINYLVLIFMFKCRKKKNRTIA